MQFFLNLNSISVALELVLSLSFGIWSVHDIELNNQLAMHSNLLQQLTNQLKSHVIVGAPQQAQSALPNNGSSSAATPDLQAP